MSELVLFMLKPTLREIYSLFIFSTLIGTNLNNELKINWLKLCFPMHRPRVMREYLSIERVNFTLYNDYSFWATMNGAPWTAYPQRIYISKLFAHQNLNLDCNITFACHISLLNSVPTCQKYIVHCTLIS